MTSHKSHRLFSTICPSSAAARSLVLFFHFPRLLFRVAGSVTRATIVNHRSSASALVTALRQSVDSVGSSGEVKNRRSAAVPQAPPPPRRRPVAVPSPSPRRSRASLSSGVCLTALSRPVFHSVFTLQ